MIALETSYRKQWLVYLLSFGIVGANLGVSEYFSIPFFCLIFVGIYAFKNQIKQVMRRGYFYGIIAISFCLFYFSLLPPSIGGDSEALHSVLSHARESFMLLILVAFIRNSKQELSDACYTAATFSAYVICGLVIFQFFQISIGQAPISLPQSWFMIDYKSTLTESFQTESAYLRPSALFSEPSVVAASLIPAFYIFLSERKFPNAGVISLGILLCGSMYGVLAAVFIGLFSFLDIKKLALTNAILVIAVLIVYLFADELIPDRVFSILYGEDESFDWRFRFPIDYLHFRWLTDDIGPKHVQSLMLLAADLYKASIFDTWIIYTLAKLGFILGACWIIFTSFALTKCISIKLLYLFGFYAMISGAPLYHDKTLMLMIFGTAIIHTGMLKKLQ